MWDCGECGAIGIAGDLDFCPQCFTPRPAEPAGEPVAEEPVTEPSSKKGKT